MFLPRRQGQLFVERTRLISARTTGSRVSSSLANDSFIQVAKPSLHRPHWSCEFLALSKEQQGSSEVLSVEVYLDFNISKDIGVLRFAEAV